VAGFSTAALKTLRPAKRRELVEKVLISLSFRHPEAPRANGLGWPDTFEASPWGDPAPLSTALYGMRENRIP
jgi:hypothetical protein